MKPSLEPSVSLIDILSSLPRIRLDGPLSEAELINETMHDLRPS